jgi:hypothetical protein
MPLAVAGIASVAAVSGYLPARKATTSDPMRHWVVGSLNRKPCVRKVNTWRLHAGNAALD